MGSPFSASPVPKPPPLPPPPDETGAVLKEISRQQTQNEMRKSKRDSFLSLAPAGGEPYRAPGSANKTGLGR